MEITCQYRGIIIPLQKWGIFREVMHAQVVHRVIFMIFFVRGKATQHLQICTTVTKKPVTHTTHNNKMSVTTLPPVALPYISMETSTMAPNHGTTTPHESIAGTSHWVAHVNSTAGICWWCSLPKVRVWSCSHTIQIPVLWWMCRKFLDVWR